MCCVSMQNCDMKKKFSIFLLVGILIAGCMKDTVKEHYTFYRPVYITKESLRAGIKSIQPTAIVQLGKIVVKDAILYLNEIDKGIHVIDITDPANPLNIAFIDIPGCVDLAINGNFLYADCYTDLVTLDISNPQQAVLKQFQPGVSPNRYYTNFLADTSKVIRTWVRVDTTVRKDFAGTMVDVYGPNSRVYLSFGGVMSGVQTFAATSSPGVAISGSMARFGLMNNRLYTVSNSDLKIFNAVTAANPTYVGSLSLQQGNIETIFPYRNNLFIGSQSGMFVYGTTDPDKPSKLAHFTHARSCDPVIADDGYAYVTLSGGSACGGYTNQLDVVDIHNLMNPSLIKSYTLTSPKGLSKDGNVLLICDGKNGLKIMDATKADQVMVVKQVGNFEGTDVIALQGTAVVTAKDGIYLIAYSQPANAAVVGKLLITQTK